MQLAKTGTPSGLIATSAFQGLAVSELGALGVSGLPLLVVEHPLGGERPEGVVRRAHQAVEQLASLIGQDASARADLADPVTVVSDPASPVTVSDTPEALLALFCEREWCDGLPVVPPTEERVRAMLGKAPADRNLGATPPLRRPATFTYCIAEREDASPWGPLSGESAVTVFGGEAPHNVNDHVSTTAAGILATVADTAVSLGSNVGWYFSQSQLLIVLGPEHAATIAADGFTRSDIQRYLFEHARLPLRTLKLGGMWGIQDWPRWMMAVTDDDALLPQVPSPDDVFVIVAGGPGKHSAVVPNCTFSRAVSRPILAL